MSPDTSCRGFFCQCAARPGEWKVQSYLDSWTALESSMTVDHIIPIALSSLSSNINKQIQVRNNNEY